MGGVYEIFAVMVPRALIREPVDNCGPIMKWKNFMAIWTTSLGMHSKFNIHNHLVQANPDGHSIAEPEGEGALLCRRYSA